LAADQRKVDSDNHRDAGISRSMARVELQVASHQQRAVLASDAAGRRARRLVDADPRCGGERREVGRCLGTMTGEHGLRAHHGDESDSENHSRGRHDPDRRGANLTAHAQPRRAR
jgi:hypothetical protein